MIGLSVLAIVVVCMMVAWEGFKIGGKAQYAHQWKYLALGMIMVMGSGAVMMIMAVWLAVSSK